jgi:hypothetical protein
MSVEDSEESALDSAELTTVPDKYLPRACRAEAAQ